MRTRDTPLRYARESEKRRTRQHAGEIYDVASGEDAPRSNICLCYPMRHCPPRSRMRVDSRYGACGYRRFIC